MNRRLALRVCFGCFAAALFTMTHWPGLKVEGPVPRTDLWAHVIAFGLWCVFAHVCAFFGPVHSRRNLVCTLALSLVYAAVDEGLQAIPALNRHASLDDYIADAAGIIIATVAVAVFTSISGRHTERESARRVR